MTPPICTDCKWSHNEWGNGEYRTCSAPRGKSVTDTLSGNLSGFAKWKYCSTQRQDGWPLDYLLHSCGRRGRWFEPREDSR